MEGRASAEANPAQAAQTAGYLAAIVLPISLAIICTSIWSFVLTGKTVAEVQGFRSAWRGFLHFMLGALIVIAGVLIVVVPFFILGFIASRGN